MAIPPFLPPGVPWLFDAVCGQGWPAGDEDALRRCAQYWDDALKSIGDLAAEGNDTSLGVLSTVAAMSADEFAKYWSNYTGQDVKDSALGQLAAQCQSMVSALDGQANEVEYTKLIIDITIVLTAIQIIWAIAAAVPSMGSSLAEIPILTLISRLTVQGFVFRFVQMVLMMVLPDLIAQGWMLEVDHTETSWDWSRTGSAGENAIVGGILGTVFGGAAAKWVPFMGEDFGKTIGQKILQGAGHFVEGGLTMDATTLATMGINLEWAKHNGDKQTEQQIEQQFSQTNWLSQFASGGVLATAFFLPSVGDSHGAPMSFTGDDGQTYTVKLNDTTIQQLTKDGTFPDGFKTPVYDKGGRLVGNATFDGPDVTVTGPRTDPVHGDLTGGPGGGGGFQVNLHDGTVQHYGYPPSDQGPSPDGTTGAPGPADPRPTAQLLSYTKPSDAPVTYQVTSTSADGTVTTDTLTGAKGSVLTYTPGPDGQVVRADLVDPKGGGYTTIQASGQNDSAPAYQVAGRAEFNYGPLGVGQRLGLHGVTHYAADGTTVLGTTNALTGHFTSAGGDATTSTAATSTAEVSPLEPGGGHAPGLTASVHAGQDPTLSAAQPTEAQSSGQGEQAPISVVSLIDPTALQAFQATGDQQLAVLGGHGNDAYEQPVAVRAQDVAGSPASWGKALVFTDTGEAMKYAERVWGAAIDQLTPDQRATLQAFTGEAIAGSHEVSYQAVNRFLRGRLGETPEIQRAITLLDEAMHLQAVPLDVVVSRTTNARMFLGADGQPLENPADLAGLIGTTQPAPAYTSTHFGAYNPGGEEVALHLMVPEGTPGLYLGAISHNPSEHELLLGRDMSFTIDAVWAEDNGWGGSTWHVQAHVSAFDGHPVEVAEEHGGTSFETGSGTGLASMGTAGGAGDRPVYGDPSTALDSPVSTREVGAPSPEVADTPVGTYLEQSRAAYEKARADLERSYLQKLADLEGTSPVETGQQRSDLANARAAEYDKYRGELENLAAGHRDAELQKLQDAISNAKLTVLNKEIKDLEGQQKALEARLASLPPEDQAARDAAQQALDATKASPQQHVADRGDLSVTERDLPRHMASELRQVRDSYRADLGENLNARRLDLTHRSKEDLSRAYEREEYGLEQKVRDAELAARQATASGAKDATRLTEEVARLSDRLPGEIAELANKYADLHLTPDQRGLRDAPVAEKTAIDDAARARTATEYQAWTDALKPVAALEQAIKNTPSESRTEDQYAALNAAVEHQHELFAAYSAADARTRVDLIRQRLAELGEQKQTPEVEAKVTYLTEASAAAERWLNGIPGAEQGPVPPRPSPLHGVLTDLANDTPRGMAIDKAVTEVRDTLMTVPGPKEVAAAGALLIDGGGRDDFYVNDAGKDPSAAHRNLTTPDGADIRNRQQRYGTPDGRYVGTDPNRTTDSEAKLLVQVKARLAAIRKDNNGAEPTGVLVIGSNKLMCPSCQALMHEIGDDYPGIQVVIATEQESVVFDSYAAERHPAWVWGSQDVGQLKQVDLGMQASHTPAVTPPEPDKVPVADVREVAANDFANSTTPDMTPALEPNRTPEQFQALAQAMRQRSAETGQIQAIVQDAHGNLHWVEGGSQAMLDPVLAKIDMGDGARILLRTTKDTIDITDPNEIGRMSPQEIRDRTLILPPDGNPVQIDWSARMDTLRSGVFIRPDDSPIDTRLTGPNLDAVTHVAGLETLAGHGGDQGIKIGEGQEITPEQIAFALSQIDRKISPIEDKAIWNALVCDFGTEDKAGALANVIGQTVRAADTTVIINKAGQYVADTLDTQTGMPQSATRQDQAPAGSWKDFHPAGSETPSQIASALNPPNGQGSLPAQSDPSLTAAGTRWTRDAGGWYVPEHGGLLDHGPGADGQPPVEVPTGSRAVFDGSGELRHVVLPDGISYERGLDGTWSPPRERPGDLLVTKTTEPVELRSGDGKLTVTLGPENEAVRDRASDTVVAYRQVTADGQLLSEPRTFLPDGNGGWTEHSADPATYEAWLASANQASETARSLFDIAARSGPGIPEREWLSNLDTAALRDLLHGSRDDAAAAIYQAVLRNEKIALRWTQMSAAEALDDGKIVNMAAGEGKSWLYLADAARQAARPDVDAVQVITTRKTLADREFERYSALLTPLGFDVHRMNSDRLPPEPQEGRPTIYVGTHQDVAFTELKTDMVPGQKLSGITTIRASVDEFDEAFVYSNTSYILSEGVRQAAPESVSAPVRWASSFLTGHLDAGQLSGTDFGREPGQRGGPAALTAEGQAKAEELLGRPLSSAELDLLNMAATARWEYANKIHYAVHDGSIYIIDPTTHDVLFNPETATESRWNGGLAQAIEAKHNLVIRDDPASSKQITARELYARPVYDRVVGASGTALGKEDQFSAQGLPSEIVDIPRYYSSRLHTNADVVSPDLKTKLDTIADEVMQDGTGRPQLILAHRNDLVSELSQRLSDMGVAHTAIDANWFLEQGTNREAAFKEAIEQAGQPGHVLVINMQGARGVDIPVTDKAKELGGLHVSITAHSGVSSDIDIQAENRAARNGDPGSVSYYISPDDDVFHLSNNPNVELAVIQYSQAHDTAPSAQAPDALIDAEQGLRDLIPGLQAEAVQRIGTLLPHLVNVPPAQASPTRPPPQPPPTSQAGTPGQAASPGGDTGSRVVLGQEQRPAQAAQELAGTQPGGLASSGPRVGSPGDKGGVPPAPGTAVSQPADHAAGQAAPAAPTQTRAAAEQGSRDAAIQARQANEEAAREQAAVARQAEQVYQDAIVASRQRVDEVATAYAKASSHDFGGGAPHSAGLAGGNERAVWVVSGQVPDNPPWYHGPRVEFYDLSAKNEVALYALYDRQTHAFLKFGISDDPLAVRYRDGFQKFTDENGAEQQRQVDVFVIAKFTGAVGDPRPLALAAERYLVKRWPGPDSKEPWAGAGKPPPGTDSAWQAVQDLIDKPGSPGGWPSTPEADQQFRDQLTGLVKTTAMQAIQERLGEINADPAGLAAASQRGRFLVLSRDVLTAAAGSAVDDFISARQAAVHLFEAGRYDRIGNLDRIYGDLAFAEPTLEQVRGGYHQLSAQADLLGAIADRFLSTDRAAYEPGIQRVREVASWLGEAADRRAGLPSSAELRGNLRDALRIRDDILAQARKVDRPGVQRLLADPNAIPGLTRSEPYEVWLSWLRGRPGMAPIADLVGQLGAEQWGDWANAAKCVHASLAYEASRRLGATVQPTELPPASVAGPASGRTLAELASVWGEHGSFAEVPLDGVSSAFRVADAVSRVFKGFGDGARGLVAVGYTDGSGHVLNVENVGGRIVFPDALDGKLDARYRFQDAEYVAFLRTDDRNPVPSKIQQFIDLPAGVTAGELLRADQVVPSGGVPVQPDPHMRRTMGQGGEGSGATGGQGSGSGQHQQMILQEDSQSRSQIEEALNPAPVPRAPAGMRGFLAVNASDLPEPPSELDRISAELKFPTEVSLGDLRPRQMADLLEQVKNASQNLARLRAHIQASEGRLAKAEQDMAQGRLGARSRVAELRQQLGELRQLERDAPAALGKLVDSMERARARLNQQPGVFREAASPAPAPGSGAAADDQTALTGPGQQVAPGRDLVLDPLRDQRTATLGPRDLPERQARLLQVPDHLQTLRANIDAVSAELARARQDAANGDADALTRAAVLEQRLGELHAAGQRALSELPGAIRDLQAARSRMRLPRLSVFDGLEARAAESLAPSWQSAPRQDDVFRPQWYKGPADALLPVSEIIARLRLEFPQEINPDTMLDMMRQLREAPDFLGMLHGKIEALRAELTVAEEFQRTGLIGADPWVKSLSELITRLEGLERDAAAAIVQVSGDLHEMREALGLGVTNDQFWLSSLRRDISSGSNLPRDLESGINLSRVAAEWDGERGWPARPPEVSASIEVQSSRPVTLFGRPLETKWLDLINRLPVFGRQGDVRLIDALVAPRIARILAAHEPEIRAGGPTELDARMVALRIALEASPAYQGTDVGMRAHIDTLIENLRAEVPGVPGATRLIVPGKGISPVTAVSVEESGHLGLHVARTADGGTYLVMRSQAASLAYTESPSNLLRPEWGYNPNVSIGPVQVLGNIPLGIHVAGLPLGVDVWLQGIGSLGPGTRIVQELDRVHEFGMRIGGSGPRFFIRQQDKLPTDPQGNFLVSKATPIVRLNVFAYLSANLSVFVPGAGWVDIPGMWPNLTADFTGTLDMPTGKVTWGAELSPALVSNWDPRDTILQNLAQALPDDVRKIINVARTTPDTPFDMSTIALVQGPALSLDWMVKWMEKPLTRFFEQRLGITPGTNAAPEPQVTVPPIAAPLPAGPPPTADNPITRELNRSTTELFDEIGDLHVQLEQIDQNLSRISADADAAVRAVEEQAAREIAAAHAAIDKWNATPPAPPGGPPKPPEPPPAPRGGPPGPSAPVPGSSAAGSSVDQVPMQDTAATAIPGSNDASLRLGSELHVVDAQGNPVPDWRARLRSEIAGYATGDFDSQETRLRLLGGHVTRGDGTRLDVRWTVGWRPRTHGTTILLDDVSVVPAAVKIIDGKMVVGRGLLGQVATGDIQLVDQRAVRRVLAEELRAAGYQNGWYHGIRNKTGRDVWIRLFGDGERPAGYDRTIPG